MWGGGDGEGEGGIPIEQSAQIRTEPAERITFAVTPVGAQEVAFAMVRIDNVGQADLEVTSVWVHEQDPVQELWPSFEVPRFRYGDRAGQPRSEVTEAEVCVGGEFVLPQGEGCALFVLYEPEDASPDAATLQIRSNDPVVPETDILLETLAAGPRVVVTPPELVFEDVLQGERATRTLLIRNVGTAELEVSAVELAHNANRDLSIGFADDSPHASLPASLDPQDAADYVALEVTYAPSRAGNDEGRLHIQTNDPDRQVVVVEVLARSLFPCVQVTPLDIDFGAVLIDTAAEATVEVSNCGNADITVSSLALVEGTSADLTLAATLDGLDDACLGDRRRPCRGEARIQPNATRTFTVRYAPEDDGADGGRVLLETDVGGDEAIEVDLFGRATDVAAPICLAQARVAGAAGWDDYPDEDEPLSARPLQTLELRSAGAAAPGGRIEDVRWRVLQRPENSTARFAPREGASEVTFLLDFAGAYVFELLVTDDLGQTSTCEAAVEALPDADLYVELGWDTPADPDQTDTGFGAGSDLDLHLLHPLGDWCDVPRDCHYAAPDPDWGVALDPSDDPSLPLDDTDGAGPEVIILNHPEDNRVYRVGVDYRDDHGYGPSFVSLRIWIRGVKRFELANKRMSRTGVFWDVATIAWPAGTITPIDHLHDAAPGGCE